jgi:hypothetical chaperone protein
MKLGIDFGTTNSAVAVVGPDGRPHALELVPGERTQRTVIHGSPDGVVTMGNAAFRAYQACDLEGRFLRSIKAFLPHDVPKTTLCGRRLAFTEVITAYLVFLREKTEALVDEPITEVTVGRPVSFHEDPVKHANAVARLEQAVRDAGFDHFRLQLEPVAAAHAYESSLDRERIVLVGDFGGGTSDFAILRVGPERRRQVDREQDVLATSGVAKAGDVLDGRFLDVFLLDALGRGARLTPRYGSESVAWDHSVLRKVQRLFDLHQLRTPELDENLAYVETHVADPVPIRRLRRLVFDDLGYPMAWAIEATKRQLSERDPATFVFDDFHSDTLDLSREVPLGEFAAGCEEVLAEYQGAIDAALEGAGLTEAGIDDVFLTGGTAQLPFVQGLFRERFGAEKLRSADAFTSVCEGLALS